MRILQRIKIMMVFEKRRGEMRGRRAERGKQGGERRRRKEKQQH